MKIHALRLSLADEDLNDLIRKYLPPAQPVEDLAARIHPDGLTISGVYPLFIKVRFETLWQLGVDKGQLTVRLGQFKAMGVPGNIFKSAIVKMIEDVARTEEWVRFQGDTMSVDLDAGIGKHAFAAQTNLTAATCEEGRIVIEAQER